MISKMISLVMHVYMAKLTSYQFPAEVSPKPADPSGGFHLTDWGEYILYRSGGTDTLSSLWIGTLATRG